MAPREQSARTQMSRLGHWSQWKRRRMNLKRGRVRAANAVRRQTTCDGGDEKYDVAAAEAARVSNCRCHWQLLRMHFELLATEMQMRMRMKMRTRMTPTTTGMQRAVRRCVFVARAVTGRRSTGDAMRLLMRLLMRLRLRVMLWCCQ